MKEGADTEEGEDTEEGVAMDIRLFYTNIILYTRISKV